MPLLTDENFRCAIERLVIRTCEMKAYVPDLFHDDMEDEGIPGQLSENNEEPAQQVRESNEEPAQQVRESNEEPAQQVRENNEEPAQQVRENNEEPAHQVREHYDRLESVWDISLPRKILSVFPQQSFWQPWEDTS